MIINENAGRALNDLIETQIKLNSDHSFWNDSIKQYLEIPDVYLTTGIVNSILMFAGRIETLVDGAIYRLYRTESEYNNGYVTIDGRLYYVNVNGQITTYHSSGIFPTDEFIYDDSTHKLKIFINTSSIIQGGIYYDVVIW